MPIFAINFRGAYGWDVVVCVITQWNTLMKYIQNECVGRWRNSCLESAVVYSCYWRLPDERVKSMMSSVLSVHFLLSAPLGVAFVSAVFRTDLKFYPLPLSTKSVCVERQKIKLPSMLWSVLLQYYMFDRPLQLSAYTRVHVCLEWLLPSPILLMCTYCFSTAPNHCWCVCVCVCVCVCKDWTCIWVGVLLVFHWCASVWVRV